MRVVRIQSVKLNKENTRLKVKLINTHAAYLAMVKNSKKMMKEDKSNSRSNFENLLYN